MNAMCVGCLLLLGMLIGSLCTIVIALNASHKVDRYNQTGADMDLEEDGVDARTNKGRE